MNMDDVNKNSNACNDFLKIRFHRFFLSDMAKLTSAAPISSGVVKTLLRLPVFYIFEECFFN